MTEALTQACLDDNRHFPKPNVKRDSAFFVKTHLAGALAKSVLCRSPQGAILCGTQQDQKTAELRPFLSDGAELLWSGYTNLLALLFECSSRVETRVCLFLLISSHTLVDLQH